MFVFRGHLQLARSSTSHRFLGRVCHVQVLDLWKVELLWTEDRAGSRDANPADEGLRRDLVVLHGVDPNKSACAAETCLAVHADGTSTRLSKVSLAAGHELVYDRLRRR